MNERIEKRSTDSATWGSGAIGMASAVLGIELFDNASLWQLILVGVGGSLLAASAAWAIVKERNVSIAAAWGVVSVIAFAGIAFALT